MPLFAIYDVESDRVVMRDTKPDGCTNNIPLKALEYVKVWYPDNFEKEAKIATTSFAMRCEKNGQIFLSDVALACTELIGLGGREAGYMAVGASAKTLKWWLMSNNILVTGLNVSGVPKHDRLSIFKKNPIWKTNKAFDSYLQKKFRDIENRPRIVIFDFVDTGASLAMVKSKLEKIAKKKQIITVAIGKGIANPDFPPDHVLGNTVEDTLLIKEMESQALKERTGRGKVKNSLKDWSNDTNMTNVSGGALQTYNGQKTALKHHFNKKTTPITKAQCNLLITTVLENPE